MVVHDIKGKDAYDEKIIRAPNDKLIVLDCSAEWCGPCKMISPILEQFSDEGDNSGVEFYKIDVDESPEVAQELGVRAMPTFFFFKNGEIIEQFVGANPRGLNDKLTALRSA